MGARNNVQRLGQLGFSAVEALVILGIVTVLGFAGWFVFQKSQNSAHKSTQQDSSNQSATVKTGSERQLITIAQWGVEAPYEGSLKLTYKIADNEATFSSKSLTSSYAGCEGYAGTIRRYDMMQLGRSGQASPFDTPGAATKIIGNYGYVFTHAQAECASSLPPDASFTANEPRIKAELTSANDAVKSVVEHLKIDSCATEQELSAACAKKEGVY